MRILLAAVAAMSLCHGAAAAVIDAEEMLKSFTVIALGDYELNGSTGGPVYAGGTFTNNGVSVNGGGVATSTDVPSGEMSVAMHGLSDALSQLSETGGESFNTDTNNPRLHIGGAGAGGIAVVNLEASEKNFFFGGNPDVVFSAGQITTVVNVGGEIINFGGNFNGSAGSANVIFNFYEALDIVLNGSFAATILAPNADITAKSGGWSGTMVGNNVTQSANIENPFSGDLSGVTPLTPVPIPATAWLLLAALGGLAVLWRRRAA